MTRKRKAPPTPRKAPKQGDRPARGTYTVQPQDPPGAAVATGRHVVPPRDRTAES